MKRHAPPFSTAAPIDTRHHPRLTVEGRLPRQSGQSSVEFAILATLLVPLLVTIPLLGKYLDLAQATEIAARYLAFEATIADRASDRQGDASLAMEVRRRFFSRSDAPIKSGEAAGDFTAHRNPLWADHTGAPLLADFTADVAVGTRTNDKPAAGGTLFAGAVGFGLTARNERQGTVTVRPRDIPSLPLFDRIGLQISRHQVILTDTWAASSSADVKARVAGASPARYPIQPLELIGDTLGTTLPPMLLDPAMDVGNTQPEIVPCDRLEGGC